MIPLRKIVSGGQTGVDRAALDWALQRGLETGGWCPRGRLAEDGVIPPIYSLNETPSSAYIVRTEANVRDSDATVIFSLEVPLRGGSLDTRRCAEKWDRPWKHLAKSEFPTPADSASRLREFLADRRIATLNIAGPRESDEPGVGEFVTEVLKATFPA